ncbi:unnamed protein product [Rotaria sordida]|uniref:Uncharacterized protein n=2 Tax=Rotaria sordida TaxID=392033 RepID=A0A815G6S5_9BILA|nr:unnamed protein product [Rotaria sordida]
MVSLSHIGCITLASTEVLSVLSMQLEYHNSLNIHFAFICQMKEFKYQLGIHLPRKSTILTDITITKNNSEEKQFQTQPKLSTRRSNSISSNICESQ